MTLARQIAKVWVLLTMGLATLAGCSGGGGDTAVTPTVSSDSPYCKTYRAWKVYELEHGEGFDQPDPAALRRFWNAYLISEETLLLQAPPRIRAAVEIKVRFIRTGLTPVMEKYAFDLRRLERMGTPAEQNAVFQGPPADVRSAQKAQYAYEDAACATQGAPPAADVVFSAKARSEAFCTALSTFNGEFDRIASSGFDPDVMRTVVTAERFEEILDRLDATAPSVIAEDVRADTEWFRTRWSDVVAEYEYDLRRIYLEASADELAVFTRTHTDLVQHSSRTTAYEEQVCES